MKRLFVMLKSVITAFGRRNFWCDSHPWLCIHCHRMQKYLEGYRIPKGAKHFIVTKTNHGLYWWSSSKVLKEVKVLGRHK